MAKRYAFETCPCINWSNHRIVRYSGVDYYGRAIGDDPRPLHLGFRDLTWPLPAQLETGVETGDTRYSWYALRTKSRYENTVASHLFARGYESFLPLYKCRRRWSDRSKEIELPLFPGYVFCQFNSLDRFPILSIPGVVHLVGVGRTPVSIDESEIAAIQAAVKSGLHRQPCPFLEIGDRVRIEHGP